MTFLHPLLLQEAKKKSTPNSDTNVAASPSRESATFNVPKLDFGAAPRANNRAINNNDEGGGDGNFLNFAGGLLSTLVGQDAANIVKQVGTSNGKIDPNQIIGSIQKIQPQGP